VRSARVSLFRSCQLAVADGARNVVERHDIIDRWR
jgi:hypothetical protein